MSADDMGDFFSHFDRVRNDQECWRQEARQTFVPGIDPADMKAGQIVTISPNLRLGDRSYTGDLYRIVAVNASHAQLAALSGFWADRGPVLLLLHEHHFYSADGFQLPEQERTNA